jgi:ATP:corrinoid adenosyltransferase
MNESKPKTMPGVSVSYAGNGKSITSNAMGMRAMQSRVWQFRGEQYLLLKSPPASGKSRALMFVALDKLHRQNLKQAIVVVPEKSIDSAAKSNQENGSSFHCQWSKKLSSESKMDQSATTCLRLKQRV